MNYPSLVNVLDVLRQEAPASFKSYHPDKNNVEQVNQARSKAFVHLFLKVRFGVLDFSDRHALMCDGSQDGGVDAYYIDEDSRYIYLIQAKFRTTAKNFEEKSIELDELMRMEVGRISKGETLDSNGTPFSARILDLQRAISNVRNIALFNWKVIFLANLKRVNDEQLKRLIDGIEYELFDHSRTYRELVFPLTTGTYFRPSEIVITINLGKKAQHQIVQTVDTQYGPCNIRMIFVPILELARITAKYKNSLLRYNPRNYLSLKKNEVNKSIRDTVLNTSANEFSLRNNGITLLAEFSSMTDRTGLSGEGQLIIKDPQILNGGQTATTLALILEDENAGTAVFESKEVLLKIIEKPKTNSEDELMSFIETISDATNKQSRIVEADRRANDPKLLRLQDHFFSQYGLFLERKRGEFQYGLDSKVITKKQVIDRVFLLRAATAFNGAPADARSSEEKMFEEDRFERLLADFDLGRITRAYFTLVAIDDMNAEERRTRGATVTGGKYALLYATSLIGNDKRDLSMPVHEQAVRNLKAVLDKWPAFERLVRKAPGNAKYQAKDGFNYDGYYKGSTVSADISAFKWS